MTSGLDFKESVDVTESTRINTVAHVRVVNGQGGGPDKTILNSPRFLEGHGFKAICAYMHPPNDAGFEEIRRNAEKWNAPLISVPDRGLRDFGVFWRLLKMCRAHHVDIWHAHDYKSNLLGLMLRPFWPMKLITTVHGWGARIGRAPTYYWLDRKLLKYYERVICVSDDLMRECVDCNVPLDRCVLVHNAIDLKDFSATSDKSDTKAKTGIASDRFIIGAVGRLAAEKAFDCLIRAVDKLLLEGHNIGLLIVGEGEERRRLQKLIDQLGRHEQIRLLGYQAQVQRFYEVMDAFALSSVREGLPNVVLEALAMRVPVVATRIAGIPHLIQDGKTGLIVSPGNADELADALRRLVTDVNLRSRLACAGRELIEKQYSFEARMNRIREIYNGVLGNQC